MFKHMETFLFLPYKLNGSILGMKTQEVKPSCSLPEKNQEREAYKQELMRM